MRIMSPRRSYVVHFLLVLGTAWASAQSPTLAVVGEPIPGGAHYALASDLDGDGDFDLLGEHSALTCLNDGEGRMTAGWTVVPQTYYSTIPSYFEAAPWKAVAVGDLNGDGLSDLVRASGNGASWSPGLPAGSFAGSLASQGVFPSDSGAIGVATGDIDGDGDIDVILSCNTAPGLRLYRNGGSGVFTNATAGSGLATTMSSAAVLRDLDGDGDLDLVVHATTAVPFGAFVQSNLGGVFGPAIGLPGAQTSPRLPAVGDFDGDGLVDVVRFGGPAVPVEILRQAPTFVFTLVATVAFAAGAPFNVRDVRAADLNGDGADELIVAGDRGAATFSVNGGVLVEYQGELPYGGDGILVFDADQDGDPDFMVTKAADAKYPSYGYVLNFGIEGLKLLPGGLTSVGFSSSPNIVSTNGSPVSAVVRDAADGTPGVVTLWDDDLNVHLHRATSDGYGNFSMQSPVPLVGGPTGFFGESHYARLTGGDFDGDGDDDLIVGNVKMPGYGDQICVAWLRNDGVAGYVAATLEADSFPGLFNTRELVSADFNGDGASDCVVLGLDVSVYLSQPGGAPALSLAHPPTTALDAAAGDFDDDGDLDLALRMSVPGVAIWVNQGDGSFTLGPNFATLLQGLVEAGDFDGDGKCDVVFGNWLILRTGPLQFAPQPLATSLFSAGQRVVFDIDDDGDLDLVSSHGHVFQNDGVGDFVPLYWLTQSNGPGVPFDIDRDGDVDLVRNEGPRLYTNVARQLTARGPVRPGYAACFDVLGPPLGLFLLAASAVELVPAVSTPYGNLSLDPFTGVVLSTGQLDASGRAVVSSLLDPVYGGSLVGTTCVVQAVVDGGPAGARLTNARPTLVLPP